MSTATNRYLDAVKTRLDITSDYALSAKWGVTPQRIGLYRRGNSGFSDERCIQVAEILGIPPENVLLEIQAERARSLGKMDVSAVLESVLRRLTATAAAILFGLCLSAYPGPASAYAESNTLNANGINALARLHLTDNVNYAQWRQLFQRLKCAALSAVSALFSWPRCSCFCYTV